MKKRQLETRENKYKEYRKEIKNIPVDVKTKGTLFKSQEVENKHNLKKKEEKKIKKEKSVFDEYIRKNRIKKFLYVLFVVIIITGLVFLVIYLCDKYLGLNLW